MLEFDGISYRVASAQDNAADAIQFINQFCIDNQIKNIKGEVVSLEIAPASPLYLILLAFGYLATLCQNLLFNIGRMLSISSCTDNQLMTLGEITRMRPQEEGFTTIRCIVYASPEGPCQILTTDSVTVQVGNTPITFNPLFEVLVPPYSAANIMLQTSSLGAFNIPAGLITSFDVNPINFLRMESLTSIPGRPAETRMQFRRRMQQRNLTYSAIEKCVEALRNLQGVSSANIYFNYTNQPEVIQGYQVNPRVALVFIQGYNPNIAKTIYSYLLCDTMPGAFSQTYTLSNGQQRVAYWEPPVFVPILIRVYIREEISNQIETAVRQAVQRLALYKDIAASVTAADVFDIMQEGMPSMVVIGAEVMLQGDTGWSQKVQAGSNEVFEFLATNISVVQS